MSTQPTAGALRAAKKLYGHLPNVAQDVMARAIDAETGLPELVAAAQAVNRALSGEVNYEHACLTSDSSESAVTPAKLLRAALAKTQRTSP